MFLRLLFESFRRQRRRKLLAGLAITLGTTAVTAMLTLATTIGDRIHAELAVYGANIIVTPAAQNLAVNLGGTDIHPVIGNAFLHESDLEKLHGIFWANNITAISPEINGKTYALNLENYRSPLRPVLVSVTGAWFQHRFGQLVTGLPQLHPTWTLRGNWPHSCAGRGSNCNGPATVITTALAEHLGLRAGDHVAYSASGETGSFWPTEVAGVLTTDDPDEERIFVDLHDAQTLFGRQGPNSAPADAVSRVEVSARTKPEDSFARKDPDTLSPAERDRWYCRPYANSIAYQIREAMPGADAQQVRRVEQSEGNVLRRISGLMWLISAAAVLAAAFAVGAAMATAILERRAEIALMRSLGAGRGRIAALFYTEAAILALAAGLLGYILGSVLSAALGAHIFAAAPGDAAQPTPHLALFTPALLPLVLGLSLSVSLLGSTPAIRSAIHLDPSGTLREDA